MSPRARANAFRIALGLAIVAGVVWWIQRDHRGPRTPTAAPIVVSSSPGASAGSAAKAPSGSDRVVPVQVAIAERRKHPVWLEGLGTVAAMQQVTVRAQVDGRLDKVLFTEGQAVKAGQVLAQIDPRPFRVRLLQAQGALARDKAQLDVAKKNLDRYKGLHAQNLVAQQQVDELAAQVGQQEGAVKMNQAAVEEALLNLDWAQVKSPLDGIAGVRLVDAGNIVRAADQSGLVVITQVDPAAVFFTVPQDKLPIVAGAMQRGGDVPVEVYNRDGSQKLATGKLAVIDNQINQATSTLRLKALVPNPSRALWPQAFVKARMLVEERDNALVVPAVAIQRGPQGVYVYIVGPDKTAALKPVVVDLISGDQAIIGKGLEGGEQVVVEGASQLRPGGRVEVAKPSGAKTAGPSAGPPATKQPAAP
ncbi:MAG: efflux RND transporter periplasmic adaptor subunit [Kofleriaceae bacterium]|nr:efflux RND transporter periplasmic adaptor subunit [Kofleriaceae bacterium]